MQAPPLPSDSPGTAPVVLYDGACGLCSRAVRFVLARDPRALFRFAALQSAFGRRALEAAGLSPEARGTMVLLEDGAVHVRSTAALRLVRRLRAPWPLLYALILVPRVARDALYDVVARHRHGLFAAPEACGLPDPALRERFLDADEVGGADPAGQLE